MEIKVYLLLIPEMMININPDNNVYPYSYWPLFLLFFSFKVIIARSGKINRQVFFRCFLKKLFIFGCVGSSFLCEGLLQLRQAGPLLIVVRGPLTIVASLVAEHRLQTRRLSSCG